MAFRTFKEFQEFKKHHKKRDQGKQPGISNIFDMDAPYWKGVEDGQSHNFDPPIPTSQMGMNRKYSYLLGWVNTKTPKADKPKQINPIPNEHDKLFFIHQRREHNYALRHKSNMVHHAISQDEEYDDDITRAMLGK